MTSDYSNFGIKTSKSQVNLTVLKISVYFLKYIFDFGIKGFRSSFILYSRTCIKEKSVIVGKAFTFLSRALVFIHAKKYATIFFLDWFLFYQKCPPKVKLYFELLKSPEKFHEIKHS